MEKDKIYEVTDADRTFFDDLVNRTPEGIINEPEDPIDEEVVEKKEELKEDEPELPEWYRPWMSVSWINGVPVRPPTKEEKSMESWK